MSFPAAALDLEMKALGRDGAPTLGAAYDLLLDQWNEGSRDREILLHLLFLAWYSIVEPPHLTGFATDGVSKESFDTIARSVLDTLLPNPDESGDAELLFVVGRSKCVLSLIV